MTGGAIIIVYTLYGDRATAEQAIRDVVQGGLAACANILPPTTSFYIWDDVYQEQTEIPVLFKTGGACKDALIQRLGETHPYEVPAILSWPADSSPAYAQWVNRMAGNA